MSSVIGGPSIRVGVNNQTLPESADDHRPPLARYSTINGALASGFVIAELHHLMGRDRGKSFGRSRHAPPDEAIYRSAFTTSRRSVLRGRPIRFGEGIKRAISAHSASVRSLA
jgi:hypothetical protein